MLCPNCSNKMKNTLHFESNKQYQFNRCPKCNERTKSKRIHFDELDNNERGKRNAF